MLYTYTRVTNIVLLKLIIFYGQDSFYLAGHCLSNDTINEQKILKSLNDFAANHLLIDLTT